MIPTVAFAAWSGTGKTTLIEKLVVALKAAGLRLAVIKHDAHRFEIDREGKDSWRFSHAGAELVLISSPDKTAGVLQSERSLPQLLSEIRDVDLILVEGYKNADLPQIGISRAATGKGLSDVPERFAAIVTDERIDTERPCFALDDIEGLVSFIQREILGGARENTSPVSEVGGEKECENGGHPAAGATWEHPRRKLSGGKHMGYTAAVITVSDKGARGERADTSGPAICAMLREAGYEIVHTGILPDEPEEIKAELIRCADEEHIALVLTTGGTGFSPRDRTPEATLAVVEREVRGIPELMRAASCAITPRGCLSRSAAGIRGGTLIVNLPGSEKAARENLSAVMVPMAHGLEMLASTGSADCGEPTSATEAEC